MASLIATREEDAQLRGRVILHLEHVHGDSLNAEDREDLYQEAWACAAEYRRRGNEIADLRAFLKTVADRRARDRKRDWRDGMVDPDSAIFQLLPDDGPGPEECAVARIDGATVWRIAASLTALETKVLEKRYWEDLKPREIMAELDLDRHRFNRTISAAVEKVGKALRSQGQWVESHRELLVRCVSETATEDEMLAARTLVQSSPKASAMLRQLRAATHEAAALAPVPALVGAEANAGTLAEQGVSVVQAARGHATGFLSRLSDPTPLAGVRPGAATAAIAGCLAVGGGATYCATEGLPDPIRPVFGLERDKVESKQPDRPRVKPASLPEQPVVPPPPPEPAEPAPTPPPPPPPVAAPAPAPAAPVAPAPAPEQEFGVESQAAAPPPASAPAPAPEPAPAPSGGGGEFGIE